MNKKSIKIKLIPLIINVAVPLFIGFLINKLLPNTGEIY